MNENITKINYYPGHMAKTKRLISENIDKIDIVYEVIDSRIPYSSKIKDIDKTVSNKRLLLEEYEKRNEKLPLEKKIFSIRVLKNNLKK